MNDNERYRAAPYSAFRARAGNRIVISTVSGERRVLSDAVFGILEQMRAFRTLVEHTRIVSERVKTSGGNTTGVTTAIGELRRQHLLISEQEFATLALRSESAAPIRTIAIPARCDSRLMERCIRSYSDHASAFGRQVRFVIAGPDARDMPGSEVVWLDSGWVERMIKRIAGAGIDPAVARFALTGQAEGIPTGVARTTGANRNAILLATRGEAFLSVDDDTLCELIMPPVERAGLSIQSAGTPLDMWFEPGLPAKNQTPEVDLLEAIGNALGQGMPASTGPILPVEFDHAVMKKLCDPEVSTPVAQVGLFGDAATNSPIGWLLSTGATHERLVSNEAAYRQALASREILMIAAGWGISDVAGLMTYCAGLDNRNALPPFPPIGRDQDGVFMLWTRAVYPSSFTAYAPFAITHKPLEARTFEENAIFGGARGLLLNDVLRLTLEAARIEGCKPGPERMRKLGASQESIGLLPAAEFRQLLLERRVDSMSRAITLTEQMLAAYGSRPAWWARDLQKLARTYEEAMAGDHALNLTEADNGPVAEELAAMQQYVLWCGRLLQAWPDICEVADLMSEA